MTYDLYIGEYAYSSWSLRGWLGMCRDAGMPVTIETHRDCITTDMLYTLQLMDAVPEMQLCADLSHFVVAREFGWPISDEVQAQITRVLERAEANGYEWPVRYEIK